MPYLSDDDIAKAKDHNETLLIHNNKVYNVSKFAKTHPGGESVLKLYHGKDVSKVMESGVHSHSKNAYRWLEQYYIADYCKEKSKTMVKNGLLNGKVMNGNGNVQGDLYAPKSMTDLVDWNEPILWQVGHMGAKYHEWVDIPVDRPLRLFKSDFCEFFSVTPWYVIPIVWLPVIALLVFHSYSSFHSSDVLLLSALPGFKVPLSFMPVLFVLGCFSWTFTEYALHRWLFHRDPPTTSYFLITLHFLLHGQHHKVPFDGGRLVFPPVAAFVLGLFVFAFIRTLFVDAISCIVMAGLLFGYVCYDLTHYYLHHGSPSKGGYFDRLRSYHVRHHFESPNLGFGISSKFWDHPFDTLITMKRTNKTQ